MFPGVNPSWLEMLKFDSRKSKGNRSLGGNECAGR